MKFLIVAIALMSGGASYDASNPEQMCVNSEPTGVWKTFSNGCVDNCIDPKESVGGISFRRCTQALTDSCDCGENHCWDGESCVENLQ